MTAARLERARRRRRFLVLLVASPFLAVAASAPAAPPVQVIGTKQRAVVSFAARDTGFTPARPAVHAGARVTLRWTVKETGFGHALTGKLFRVARVDAGQTAVVRFRAPKKPGTAITFAVTWPDNGQLKYRVTIRVVR